MSFAEWAVNHVDGDKRSTRFRRIDDNKHEYELWERDDNVDMSIRAIASKLDGNISMWL